MQNATMLLTLTNTVAIRHLFETCVRFQRAFGDVKTIVLSVFRDFPRACARMNCRFRISNA